MLLTFLLNPCFILKVNGIDIDATIAHVKQQLEADKTVTPALKLAIETLLLLVMVLTNRIGLNSKNSSKPPSTDDDKKKKKSRGNGKPGGQKGRVGANLKQIEKPDVVEVLKLDKRKLPKGNYKEVGVEKRQFFDIEFKTVVTEYQAQILADEQGNRYTAEFPKQVTQAAQYGEGVKAHAVYLSQYQLLPYERIREYFADQLQLPISSGTLVNFNTQAGKLMRQAHHWLQELGALDVIKSQLKSSTVLHADETGMNMNGSKHWLHTASTNQWTYFTCHKKRGKEATDAAGVLSDYQGVLVHDHWKPYFKYDCLHALCNAHHVRELEFALDKEEQSWAEKLQKLLFDTQKEVEETGGQLGSQRTKTRLEEYRIIKEGGWWVNLVGSMYVNPKFYSIN